MHPSFVSLDAPLTQAAILYNMNTVIQTYTVKEREANAEWKTDIEWTKVIDSNFNMYTATNKDDVELIYIPAYFDNRA